MKLQQIRQFLKMYFLTPPEFSTPADALQMMWVISLTAFFGLLGYLSMLMHSVGGR